MQGGGHVCPTLTAQSMGICRIEKFDRGGQDGMQHSDNLHEDKEYRSGKGRAGFQQMEVSADLFIQTTALHQR